MADVNVTGKVSSDPISVDLEEKDERFKGLGNGKALAIDIGCSLTKVAYYSATKHKSTCNSKKKYVNKNKIIISNSTNEDDSCSCGTDTNIENICLTDGNLICENISLTSHNICSPDHCQLEPKSHLHFVKFPTECLENCLDFIANHLLGNKESGEETIIKVTGRGVCKYANYIKEKLGVILDEEDETSCLIKGTNFLLKNIDIESFTYGQKGYPDCVFHRADFDGHPFLLVDIGSGVSIYKVTEDDNYKKIGSSTLGGATFLGLGSLLTSTKEFDRLIALAENGDNLKVDLVSRDIFENACPNISNTISASFGKISLGESSQGKFSEADVIRSLLFAVLNNIGQIASLYATMNNVTKVYFGGYFLRNNLLCMDVLTRSMNYWSNNKVKALFFQHEGYLGTVGAFLKGVDQWRRQSSSAIERRKRDESLSTNQFSVCPLLLHPDRYRPDLMDLVQDEEAREYWLTCFEGTVAKVTEKAVESQSDNPTAVERGKKFKEKFLNRLQELKVNPSSHGTLTVRSILDMIPSFLNEFDFPDPYLNQKIMENKKALTFFEDHIKSLDALDVDTRHRKLILYLIAGNMFDWGAKEVSVLLETNNFGFDDALRKIPDRPWLIDSLDEWVQRLEGPPHKCAAVFVDNSGFDIILGILPFVRELLSRGTEVILCCNSGPALNDVIHTEMLDILKEIKKLCPIIKAAEENGRLIAMESGQTGPCLDLSRLNKNLCEEMAIRNVDLIIIEGMGRSVHTNLNTQFKCESLKVAVIKNRWLAQRLKGTMFCALCQYNGKPI